jgi:hypothetical protein
MKLSGIAKFDKSIFRDITHYRFYPVQQKEQGWGILGNISL